MTGPSIALQSSLQPLLDEMTLCIVPGCSPKKLMLYHRYTREFDGGTLFSKDMLQDREMACRFQLKFGTVELSSTQVCSLLGRGISILLIVSLASVYTQVFAIVQVLIRFPLATLKKGENRIKSPP